MAWLTLRDAQLKLPDAARRYGRATHEPLHCLAFLLPLVLAYEVGALLVRAPMADDQQLVAPRLIQELAAWVGIDAAWVPGVALVLTLVIWQVVAHRPWRCRARVPLIMLGESLLLALPLFVLGRLLQQTAESSAGLEFRARVVAALGAGIYEELVFRFYLIGGLKRLLADGFHVPQRPAVLIAAAVATIAFAGCHFHPVGAESFTWLGFLLLSGAGAYLAAVFVFRGLGVATGCHVAYNLVSLLLPVG